MGPIEAVCGDMFTNNGRTAARSSAIGYAYSTDFLRCAYGLDFTRCLELRGLTSQVRAAIQESMDAAPLGGRAK